MSLEWKGKGQGKYINVYSPRVGDNVLQIRSSLPKLYSIALPPACMSTEKSVTVCYLPFSSYVFCILFLWGGVCFVGTCFIFHFNYMRDNRRGGEFIRLSGP